MSAHQFSTAPEATPPAIAQSPAPALPAEVLNLIFELAVPSFRNPRAFAKRAKLLCRFSLVSKAWHATAQATLFQLVCLPLPSSAWKLVGSGVGKRFGQRTRFLKLGKEWERAESDMNWHKWPATTPTLLKVTPFITEMWLEEVTVDPAVLSWVQDLKTLHLHDVELKLPADRYYWHLPKLQTLFMSAVSVTASDDELISARPLFTPFTLPALTKLAWTWDEDNTGPELQLGHQLTHLFLHRTPITTASNPAPRYPALPDSLLPSLTSIQHLFFTIRYLSDIPPLGSIPSFLHSLHLSFFPGSERQVEPHLVQTGPKPRCLDHAAVLFIPPVRKQQMEHDEEGKAVEPEWRVKTRQWAGATSLYEVEMKMDAQDTMDTDAKRWLHHVSQVAWSPPATVTDPSKEDNTNSNLVVETNVAVRSDEEQKQPEGEVGEEGKEAGEPPRNDGVAQ